MPIFPAKVADAREIATTNEVKKQIVTFDETAWTTIFHLIAEDRAIIRVSNYFDAGERNAIDDIDSNVAARFFDLTQVVTAGAWIETNEVIADAAAAPTWLPLFLFFARPAI